MADRRNILLSLTVRAKDEATSVLGKIQALFGDIGSRLADVAQGAARITVDTFRWALDTVRPAEALERQLGKIEQALRNAGAESELTAQQVDALARELDEASLGSAAAFRDAAAQLIGFGVTSEDSLRRVLTAAQDLSEAGFGSLEANAAKLGRAIQDPIRGMQLLERSGVSLSAEQKNLIEQMVRLGDVAGAQNVILGEVERRYGGLAAAAGGGLAGALDLVGKRITDFKETLGGVLAPVLTALTTAFAGIISTVNETAARLAGPLKAASEQAGQALRTLAEGVGAFLAGVLQRLGDWINNLDWASLQQGAENAQVKIAELWARFVDLGKAVQTFSDTVKVAFNGVQIAFNAVLTGVQGLIAGFLAGLAQIEGAAAKVGLGTLERSAQLQAEAERWKTLAAESAAAIARDAGQAGEALDRLTGRTDAAAESQERLAAAAESTAVELGKINQTLDDYQARAARAAEAATQAGLALARGAITAEEYGRAMLAAAEAAQDLADAQDAEALRESAAATQALTSALVAQISQLETITQENAKLAKAQDDVAAAQRRQLQAELELAKARGDTVAVMRITAQLAADEVAQAQAAAEAKRAEAEILRELVKKREELLAAQGENNAEAEKELDLLRQKLALADAEAAAAEATAQRLAIKTQATRENTEATRENTAAKKDNAAATEKAASAQERMAERTKGAAAQASAASAIINGWNDRLGKLSENAKEAFGRMALGADATRASVAKATDAMELMRIATQNLTAGGFITWANKLAIQALQVELAFKSQAAQAERLTEKLNTLQNVTSQAMDGLIRRAEVARDRMDLLDDVRLDNLQAAIDGARERLRSLAEEADAARDALARLNAEIAREKGDDETARKLDLEIEQRQRLAELERNLEAARLAGNRELVQVYEQQRQKLLELFRIKEKNLRAERGGGLAAGPSAAPEASGGGVTTVNNTFMIDPTQLADEEWVRRNVLPAFNNVLRLRS